MPTRRRAPQSVPDLPAEMIVAIVRASKHGATLVRLRQVCKAWRRAIDAESASLWREAALERFPRIREFVAAANLRAPCYRSMYRAQIEAESAICLPRTYLDAYVLSAELQVREHSEEGDGWRRGGGRPCCSHGRVSAYLNRAARDGAVEVFSTRTPWWYQKWGQILPTHALQLKVQRAWRNATARDAGLAMSMRFAKAPDGKGYEPVLG